MNDSVLTDIPVQYHRIKENTERLSFQMNSDLYTGSLLKTLVASKRSGRILELGTGGGLATSWILEGLDQHPNLLTVENNTALLEIARQQLTDPRIEFVLADAIRMAEGISG